MTTGTLAPGAPFVFARGDTWQMPVTYTAPGTGTPIDLTGSTVSGSLILARRPLPVLLTGSNGGLTLDAVAGGMTFELPPAESQYAVPDPYPPGAIPVGYAYPNRLIVTITDTLGNVETTGIFPVLVYDARLVPIGAAPQNGAGVMTAGGPQGPPGPSFGTYAAPITALGQTVFNWPNGAPSNLGDVGLLVNGIEYRPPDISATATALTWNGLFTLDPTTDTAFARYR